MGLLILILVLGVFFTLMWLISKTSENLTRKTMLIVGSVFLVFFALAPFIWMLIISFTSSPDFLVTGSYESTFQNYVDIFAVKSLHFPKYLGNSLLIAVIVSLTVTLIASMAGYAVSRMRFPGRMIVPLFILAMSMFPQISIVGFLYNSFAKMGMLDTYGALILPYIAWTVPIALWINMSYFQQIPVDLDKAALVDGASRMKTLFKVILPVALPGIFSSFLLVFISCFNEFLFALMLTSSKATTVTVGIALFQGTHGEIPWGTLMAASAVASVPLVVLTLIFQKYIVQGLAAGSVKG